MIKRSIGVGLLVGAIFALVAVYPTIRIFGAPAGALGDQPSVFRSLLLAANIVAIIVGLSLVGSVAAWKAHATQVTTGFQAGAISGLVVSVLYYSLVLAPTVAVASSIALWRFEPSRLQPYPPDPVAFQFIQQMTRGMILQLAITLTAGVLLGGIEGAIIGLARQDPPAAQPLLLDVIDSPHPRRTWFTGRDASWKAGLVAGLLGGFVMWLSLIVLFVTNLKVEWPMLESAVTEDSDLVTQALFTGASFDYLLPLFVLAVLGIGALAVLLLRDPPRRHLTRFQTVLIAGVVAAVPVLLIALQVTYFLLGLSRYAALYLLFEAQTVDPAGALYVDPTIMEWLRNLVQTPQMLTPVYYLAPVVLFATVLILVLLWIGPQAVFYGLTLPLVFRRPVDRAGRMAAAINNQPASLLPQLYGLYTKDDQAIQVLPHLVFQAKDRAAATTVAAYHTLSTQPAEAGRSLSIVRQTLAETEKWRWQSEVGELYRILDKGLSAKTLADVMAIKAPPEEITSTLPSPLATSCAGLGRVLGELEKAARVEDVHTKLIFFNSAHAAILDLRRRTEPGGEKNQAYETPYPEMAVIHSLLDSWQGLVLTATQDLQGRADLHAILLAPRSGYAPRVRQCVVVSNRGLNVAQNVQLAVADGESYHVSEGAEQRIDILGPGESREMEFWLVANGPQRLRVAWQLTFDDAVDQGRRVHFADALELTQAEIGRPFQRIFPIPYVTGTPLRSGEMFVGRQDIFEFVQEHLLGAYQNNVIVLHGQRRTGKTSILYRLQEMLTETHVAILVDMQGKAARGMADFLYDLSDDICYNLENRGISIDLPERAAYEAAPEFTFRSRFLRAVTGRLGQPGDSAHEGAGGRNLLLMFDEFEELQKRVEDGRLEPEIFPFLRNLMQHESQIDFVFSGTHKLEELGAEYWSILFNIAAYKRITFLDPDEVRRLASEPVAEFGMEYDPLAMDRIIQVTAGHPYFAQVVCHEMVAYHNETERSYITVSCVDRVLERIIERGEAHFKYIWAGSTRDEHNVMLALADLLPDADASATPMQLTEELERKGRELQNEELTRAMAALQTKDILSRHGPQSNLYRFKIDLIRRWIAIARPSA